MAQIIEARVKNIIQTEAEWLAANPIILKGEVAYVQFGNLVNTKVGDGIKTFSQLTYNLQVPAAFRGTAMKVSNPGIVANQEFYFAGESGVFPNFSNLNVDLTAGLTILVGSLGVYTMLVIPFNLSDYAKKIDVVFKSDILSTAVNLANPNDAGVQLGNSLGSDGGIGINSSYNTTGFIAIGAKVRVAFTCGVRVSFYTSAKAVPAILTLSRGTEEALPGATTSPDATAFMRVSVPLAKWSTFQVELGEWNTAYLPYGIGRVKPELLTSDPLVKSKVAKSEIYDGTPNLMDQNDVNVKVGYILGGTGDISVNALYNTSGFMPVVPGQQIAFSSGNRLAFYNIYKDLPNTVTSRGSGPELTPFYVTVPTDMYFVRMSFAATAWSTALMNIGSTLSTYYPYGTGPIKASLLANVPVNATPVVDPTGLYGTPINLLNPVDIGVQLGYVIGGNGLTSANALYNTSGFMPATSGVPMTFSAGKRICFYDTAKALLYVEGPREYDLTAMTLTPPANTVYARTSIRVVSDSWSKAMVQLGSVNNPYTTYGTAKVKQTELPYTWPDLLRYIKEDAYGKYHFRNCIFVGDSIMNAANIQPFVAAQIGLNTYSTNAVSGSTMTMGTTSGVVALSDDTRIKAILLSGADMLFGLIGTNDWFYGAALGAFGSTDKATFFGAYAYFLDTLIKGFPTGITGDATVVPGIKNLKIIMSTMFIRGIDRAQYAAQKAYVDAAVQVCNSRSVPIYNAFNNMGITYENISYFSSDNIHPTASIGVPYVAEKFSNYLKSV
jgi:hypothetical protein